MKVFLNMFFVLFNVSVLFHVAFLFLLKQTYKIMHFSWANAFTALFLDAASVL